MSQLILTGIGDPAQNVRLEEDPELKVGPDDVLLRLEAAPVNPVDTLFSNGWYAVQPQIPGYLGAEGVGRVLEAGTATDQSLIGKRVVVLGTYEQGVWADVVALPARNVVVVPEGIDALQLSMAVINPATAYLMLTKYVDLKPGDWVGQNLGNSAVGRSVLALAKESGLKTLSVVRGEKAAADVRALGGDLVLVDGDDLAERIAEALRGEKLRLVLDGAAGSTASVLGASLEFGGTSVTYSSTTGEPPAVPLSSFIYREIVARGFWVVNWFHNAPRAELEKVVGELVDLVARGVISVPVDSTFGLDQYAEALARSVSPDRDGKVLFVFDVPKP